MTLKVAVSSGSCLIAGTFLLSSPLSNLNLTADAGSDGCRSRPRDLRWPLRWDGHH